MNNNRFVEKSINNLSLVVHLGHHTKSVEAIQDEGFTSNWNEAWEATFLHHRTMSSLITNVTQQHQAQVMATRKRNNLVTITAGIGIYTNR